MIFGYPELYIFLEAGRKAGMACLAEASFMEAF